MSISAIIITRNEAENIAKCIDSLEFADEIIVVDNNSEDDTLTYAKKKGAKVYQVDGLDFSRLRNIGRQKASGKWLFYLDADEKVSQELAKEITSKVKNPKNYSAFYLRRKNFYFNKPWPVQERVIRLMNKKALIKWQGKLHETPQIEGKIGNLSSSLLHYTHKSLTDMVNKTNQWSEIEAQLRYESGHPPIVWWRFIRVIVPTFIRYYIVERGWRTGAVGLIESIFQAFSVFITYAKLWEKQNKQRLTGNNRIHI